jgi:hypothetical protein
VVALLEIGDQRRVWRMLMIDTSSLTEKDIANIRLLRTDTNLGIMDVKRAYQEADGNMMLTRVKIRELEQEGLKGI